MDCVNCGSLVIGGNDRCADCMDILVKKSNTMKPRRESISRRDIQQAKVLG